MARQVDNKGAEYVHRTGMDLQEFHPATRPEAAISRSDMNKLCDDLHQMELTRKNPWKYLTAKV